MLSIMLFGLGIACTSSPSTMSLALDPATLLAGPETICNSTTEVNMSRRDCTSSHSENNISTPAECAALCCRLKPSHPAPYPNDGCEAWTLNNYKQCFICMADSQRRPNGPPASTPANCKGGDSECATGIVTPPPPPPRPPPRKTGPLGGEASVQYVDQSRNMRWPSYINGSGQLNRTTELSPEGWPLIDCQVTVFDDRPAHAWAPPIDDPEKRQMDYSGVWTLRISGKADVSLSQSAGLTLGTPAYNETSNKMTQTITFAKGKYPTVQNLLVIKFNNTQQNSSAPLNSGFRDLEVLMPGYGDKSGDQLPLYTDDWAAALGPYDHIRWMGITGTNSYSWLCGGDNAAGCSVIRWEDRHLPNYTFNDQNWCLGCHGLPWEHVLLAANELNKDIWINVPITASAPTVCRTAAGGDPRKCLDSDPTTTYEYQLAKLFKEGNEFTAGVGLKENLNIYIEHSNEVWNFGFKQFSINSAMANWEVLNGTATVPRGKSNLLAKVPSRPDLDKTCSNITAKSLCWAQRRHARRVYEIGKTFEKVFGANTLNKRIRMVYASWSINEQSYFNDTLAWLGSEYGPVKNYLYAIAATQYFGPEGHDGEHQKNPFSYDNATVPSTIKAFKDGADAMIMTTVNYKALSTALGVKIASYESGPGYAVGKEKPGTKALNTMIEASRAQGMFDAVYHDIREVCWNWGWDIYNYFSTVGACSTYGCWGATEDFKNLNPGPPKLQAIYNLTGTDPTTISKWATDPKRARASENSRTSV